jgi:hypothetical protein
MNRPKITVAEYLATQIDLCGKTQMEIAREVGFEKPNVITMFKQGKSKLPISRVGKMAKALGVDPFFLYELVMREYEPDTWTAIESDVMRGSRLTLSEREVLKLMQLSGASDATLSSEDRSAISRIFQGLAAREKKAA